MSKRSDKLKALLLYQQLNWHKISALIENMVKYSILTIQQLKVVAASSTKTVLWNAWVWRISNYGDYSPLWYNLWCGGCLCLAFHLLFKSCSTYCDQFVTLFMTRIYGHLRWPFFSPFRYAKFLELFTVRPWDIRPRAAWTSQVHVFESKKTWDERIYEVKTLSSTIFWSSCLHPIK